MCLLGGNACHVFMIETHSDNSESCQWIYDGGVLYESRLLRHSKSAASTSLTHFRNYKHPALKEVEGHVFFYFFSLKNVA